MMTIVESWCRNCGKPTPLPGTLMPGQQWRCPCGVAYMSGSEISDISLKSNEDIRRGPDIRTQWECIGTDWEYGDSLSVTITETGVLFEIDQDHAVDSYNSNFTNQLMVPWDRIEELTKLLSESLEQRRGEDREPSAPPAC